MAKDQNDPFARAKRIEIVATFERTVSLTNVPVEFMSSLLTMGSLHRYASIQEYRVQQALAKDPEGYDYRSAEENLAFVETEGRILDMVEERFKGAVGTSSGRPPKDDGDLSIGSVEEWTRWNRECDGRAREAFAKAGGRIKAPAHEPFRSLGKARISLQEALRHAGYGGNIVRGLLARNENNRASSFIEYMDKLIRHATAAKAHMERYVELTKDVRTRESDPASPLEKAV